MEFGGGILLQVELWTGAAGGASSAPLGKLDGPKDAGGLFRLNKTHRR
jgi:hypothetical protein